MKFALISTEKGDMKVELYEKETPITVANFVRLASERFYDGLTFHRVIPDFVIQGLEQLFAQKDKRVLGR